MATVEILGPATVGITFFLTVGWIVRTIAVNRRQKAIASAQIEAHTKLLERFGSAAEAQAYLESDAGKRFLELATVERVDPVGRVIQSIQQGLVLLMAGAAFLAGRGLDGRRGRTRLRHAPRLPRALRRRRHAHFGRRVLRAPAPVRRPAVA